MHSLKQHKVIDHVVSYSHCFQEFSTTSNRAQEIKAGAKLWKLQRRPINAVVTYKDCLYSASSIVEGSNLKVRNTLRSSLWEIEPPTDGRHAGYVQEWKRHGKPQMSLKTGKRERVMAMGITEDFIYLNCSSSTNSIQVSSTTTTSFNIWALFQPTQDIYCLWKQIWLRGTQQKVGRISAGSKITSLLTANDIILCGTEAGQIKVCALTSNTSKNSS